MSGYSRAGQPGAVFLTRVSDGQCPRVEECGYRCEAGRGDHDGPHLFEEHVHVSPAPAGLDDFGSWVRWFLDANPNAESGDLIDAIRERSQEA